MRSKSRPVDGSGTDRGVSEAVGFVLTFSVILLSVGTVYAAGSGALLDISGHAEVNSAQDAMEALAVTFEQIGRSDGENRANEIRLNGGEIAVAGGSTFEVDVAVADGPDPPATTVTTGSVRIGVDDSRIEYQSGAVFRGREDGAVMTHEPSVICDPDRAVVSLIAVAPAGNVTAVGFDGSVVVSSAESDSSLLFPTATGGTYQRAANATAVELAVTSSPYADEWGEYLTGNGWTKSGSTYTCTADRVFVRLLVLDVGFST
ncbi:DUF7289 family protein [Halorarum halobium]|uniref:DUF7289 family protein n=1 Tax=Halorarum halobium TaxID=3075121 RepID=UPI0028AA6BC0|nr:hypothetical protein [Halobaculum sp. XH14]